MYNSNHICITLCVIRHKNNYTNYKNNLITKKDLRLGLNIFLHIQSDQWSKYKICEFKKQVRENRSLRAKLNQ